MSEALTWLPPGTLADARTAEPVARAIAEWSDAWLSTGALSTAPRWEPATPGVARMGYATVHSGGAWKLTLRTAATLDLASLLLGRELGDRDCRTPQDRAITDHLVKKALAGLIMNLSEILDVGEPSTGGDWFSLPIDRDGSANLLILEAAHPVLVLLAASWIGPPRATASLPPRRSSLESQSVRLAARIGSSRLALAEIDALAVGDVLTLDVPVSAAIGARLDDGNASDGALSLIQSGESFKLQIERPVHQW